LGAVIDLDDDEVVDEEEELSVENKLPIIKFDCEYLLHIIE